MDSETLAPPGGPLSELITTFNELNGAFIDELDEEPSPLEFMRYVARNTPFVVRGAASSWRSNKTWDKEFLLDVFKDQTVNVAVTPFGNADAPTFHDGGVVFAKPHEEHQDFEEFLNYVIGQERSKDTTSEVRYAQTRMSFSTFISSHNSRFIILTTLSQTRHQPSVFTYKDSHISFQKHSYSHRSTNPALTNSENDNLRNEYLPLFNHVPPSVPFARIALDRDPDAINLWIGNARSVTALHKDNYENIYVQVRGRKHFVLLPPLCHPCVNEQSLTPATYHRHRKESCSNDLTLELDRDDDNNANEAKSKLSDKVPFATWDPDFPQVNATPYSHLAEPVRVTLEPGDMLYLPAMWYHKVSQSCPEDGEGFALAVNYWYDMEFSGPLYPFSSFVRNISLQKSSPSAARQ
ncbi:JmjC domain-containing protein 7 [Colletotrichum gloeosporioides]|uniref:JmjC domain-containing protein 7 n=1 Tax=Colletotrichum gloeosporioides TaxID=474922 RepID=A0A8H4FR57_COLGL|nr:JmjC domain-containing protein 7 [Colletotrichum gloeosporioides]KAF3811367.1 JmjC domain-containing protein 7 [Colletotrichum gloeosporioides]